MPNNEKKKWRMYKRASVAPAGTPLKDLPIGSLVKDVNSTFLGAPIVWKIADINHEGYPNNSVTLISDKVLATRAFDAAEPNNPDDYMKESGNESYPLSNIRQWLNSDAEAGNWYTPQHEYDQAPTKDCLHLEYNPYSDEAGFLNGFSEGFRSAMLATTLVVNTDVESTSVTDKMFLPSASEAGTHEGKRFEEGTVLALFSDGTSDCRRAYMTKQCSEDTDYTPTAEGDPWSWHLRGVMYPTGNVLSVGSSGGDSYHIPKASTVGVRPLCNISSNTIVSETPDEDGVYTIVSFVGKTPEPVVPDNSIDAYGGIYRTNMIPVFGARENNITDSEGITWSASAGTPSNSSSVTYPGSAYDNDDSTYFGIAGKTEKFFTSISFRDGTIRPQEIFVKLSIVHPKGTSATAPNQIFIHGINAETRQWEELIDPIDIPVTTTTDPVELTIPISTENYYTAIQLYSPVNYNRSAYVYTFQITKGYYKLS